MGESADNVVLVTVDSLRRDAIGPYGDRHTPTFERIAERGVVFDHAFATGNWTPFSFPSILASRPVFADTGQIGVTDHTTLAERLSEAGYATAGFNAANGFLTSHWGYDDGFDEFDSFVTAVGSSVYSRYLATHPTVEAWLQLATSPVRRAVSYLRGDSDEQAFLDTSRGLDVESAATEFVAETDEPFFLWLHYMDPHTPYVPAPRYVREVSGGRLGTHRMLTAHARTGLGWEVGPRTLSDLRTLYQAAVRQTDDSLDRVLSALEAAGVRRDTAVVVAGDHGEEFQEHGHLAHYPKLYDELIRVPFLVDAPGVDADESIDASVGLDAIPPTVCDLLGVDPAAEWTGRSALAFADDADGSRGSDSVAESDAPDRSAGTDASDTAVESADTDASDTAVESGETSKLDTAVESAGTGELDTAVEPAGTGELDATEPVVSVTVRGESVTTQPIPRGLDDGELIVSARTAAWTLIEHTATGDRELYHRPTDPTQQRNVAADAPAVTESGRTTAAATNASPADTPGEEPPDPPEAVLSALRRAIRERRRELERVESGENSDVADEDLDARLTALGYK